MALAAIVPMPKRGDALHPAADAMRRGCRGVSRPCFMIPRPSVLVTPPTLRIAASNNHLVRVVGA